MRLYPPVFLIGRESVRDVEIGGHRLAIGTICLVSQWVVHRDRRFWRDPNSFRPERWAAGADPPRPRFAYFPFGGGPRICIGRSFAVIEAVLVLATLFRRFRLVAPPRLQLRRVTPQIIEALQRLRKLVVSVRGRVIDQEGTGV